jgi:hypothetical protein
MPAMIMKHDASIDGDIESTFSPVHVILSDSDVFLHVRFLDDHCFINNHPLDLKSVSNDKKSGSNTFLLFFYLTRRKVGHIQDRT